MYIYNFPKKFRILFTISVFVMLFSILRFSAGAVFAQSSQTAMLLQEIPSGGPEMPSGDTDEDDDEGEQDPNQTNCLDLETAITDENCLAWYRAKVVGYSTGWVSLSVSPRYCRGYFKTEDNKRFIADLRETLLAEMSHNTDIGCDALFTAYASGAFVDVQIVPWVNGDYALGTIIQLKVKPADQYYGLPRAFGSQDPLD